MSLLLSSLMLRHFITIPIFSVNLQLMFVMFGTVSLCCLFCKFLPCEAMLAHYMLWSFVLSVHLSQVGVLRERLNIVSREQCCTIAQIL